MGPLRGHPSRQRIVEDRYEARPRFRFPSPSIPGYAPGLRFRRLRLRSVDRVHHLTNLFGTLLALDYLGFYGRRPGTYNAGMRILLFTGKGGVGKTSLAAATGVKL